MDKTRWTAKWNNLAIANYDVDPAILAPYLPVGCELDTHEDRHTLSLVGFEFKDARFRGWCVPFHQNFIEFNMRFYVKGIDLPSMTSPRGIVFIKEIVPRKLVTMTANNFYNESFVTMPMCSHKSENGIAYSFHDGHDWRNMILHTENKQWSSAKPGGLARFISDRNFGFCKRKDGGTDIYKVTRDDYWYVKRGTAEMHGMEKAYASMLGKKFFNVLRNPPRDAYLFSGSHVSVSKRVKFCNSRGEFR